MIANALTVDVEDYFHVSAFAESIKRSDWDSHPLRVEANTRHLLALFDRYDARATFFVLGWVAERIPALVREIASQGHEIACHGYSHRPVYTQDPESFREETRRSKAILEDAAQMPVLGYRAASFSITERSLWALDILVEEGFVYDSSIFPIHHDRYGIPGAPAHPYLQETPAGRSVIEFPMSTVSILGYRLPVAGGGYFRLYPYCVTRTGLRHINRRENQPFIFYLHPWEIDQDQPRVRAGRLSHFRHYNNLEKCEARLQRLMTDFRFTTARDVLRSCGLDGNRMSTQVDPPEQGLREPDW